MSRGMLAEHVPDQFRTIAVGIQPFRGVRVAKASSARVLARLPARSIPRRTLTKRICDSYRAINGMIPPIGSSEGFLERRPGWSGHGRRATRCADGVALKGMRMRIE